MTAWVAPDFADRVHSNTLAIRPELRISLRLGRVENLFPTAPSTPEGRMARLQVLGLFYPRLGHSFARKLLEGSATLRGTRIPGCWDWVKERVFHCASDEEADACIQAALERWIVGGADSPMSGIRTDVPFGLPDASEFAKVRVPGGYAFTHSTWGGTNDACDHEACAALSTNPYDIEERNYAENEVLGKLPLIARVERRAGDAWEPAPDVDVFFHLVPPADLPAGSPGPVAYARFDAPPSPGGISDSVEAEERAYETEDDPLPRNCHKDWGGKRGFGSPADGSDVDNIFFATYGTAGFNRPHPDRNLVGPPFRVAERVAGRPRHAVRARTNADGEAGVVFLPSRMGGDRYRIAAFAEVDEAVRVETGTLVVWRSVRLSRYLRKEASTGVWPPLIREAAECYAGWPENTEQQYLQSARLTDDSGHFVGLSALHIGRLEEFFARGYCELESDADPEEIDGREYARALAVAREDGERGAAELGVDIALDALLHDNWADLEFPNENSIALVIGRTPEAYNARLPEGDARRFDFVGSELHPDDRERAAGILDDYVMAGFMRALSYNGALPGLTLVHGPAASTWQVFRLAHGWAGRAYEYRGCFTALGARQYRPPRDFTQVAAHELGHDLFRQHAPGHDPDMPEPGGDVPAEHDPPSEEGGDDCVMSYKNGIDAFCSRCLLAFRGWDIERR